ncbi:3-oxoacyl-[acyl-carrier-protein] synthase II [Kitasatospora sp. MAP12-15]|uniref:beta-ketoacyl synthase N-terminal-like domain-containing protein n=1 Tax=unclassified Kitasatospora TaxID=2633591 RepID=UPI0024754AA4|nr:beta-ketoacyl synthase N-terminal-like domain-containing protein [Kitasatospora sp. MAP12-44]MDH6108614.1 3-oxoacyl-[acyl-carrier-protein] synthase II [Kitasatospora sp. MAP12-44]
MPIAISGFDVLSCLGDAEDTFQALLRGDTGVSPLRRDTQRLGVDHAYEIADDAEGRRASRWLARVVAGAVSAAGLDTVGKRVAVVVGTGLRELPDAEWWWVEGDALTLPELHFGAVVRGVLPEVGEVLTISNACAASGYALAVGADLLTAGEADAVVVAGCDSITDSLLAVIGRGSAVRSTAVRPFDSDREGVLLGEGAAAVVIEPEEAVLAEGREVLARLHGVGLSCDAYHETAPDPAGIAACMRDAHRRAGVVPAEVDLVVAHGTSTALNDPAEAAALTDVFGDALGHALVTGIKGAVGHTSGAAALMSVVVAIQAMRDGVVPAIGGLTQPIPEAEQLGLVAGAPRAARPLVAQIDSFGFGGVNAVALVGVAR